MCGSARCIVSSCADRLVDKVPNMQGYVAICPDCMITVGSDVGNWGIGNGE